jgi:hypothetical protein
MIVMRVGAGVTAVIAVLSAGLAGATVWLLLTNPASVAGALDQGNFALVAQVVAAAVGAAVRALVRWL